VSHDVSSNVGNASEFEIELNVEQKCCDAVLRYYRNICKEGLRKNIKILTRNCSHLTVQYIWVLCFNFLSHSALCVNKISHTVSYSFIQKVEIGTFLLTYLLTFLFTYFLTYSFILSLTHSLTFLLSYLLAFSLTYLLTYLLSPFSRVLLEKLTASQLVKKFLTFYGTRKFITALTSARHVSLS